MSLKSEITIGLTMGDPNGIGPEVLIRALQFFHPFREWTPLIFGDIEVITEMNNILGAPFSYISITSDQSRPQEKSNNDFCIPVIDLTVRIIENGYLARVLHGRESAFQYVYNAIQWANIKKLMLS